MKPPLVSVLMTAYNREDYIAAAIESVLTQKFTDFELIIVDDVSKDRTIEIAKRYESDPRVRVYANEKNLSDYPNRNRAAGLARGRYLKYLDADDVMYAHCLDVMARCMERFPEAAVGLESEFEHGWPQPFPLMLSPVEAYREHFLDQGILHQGPSGAIIRADVFHEFGGFLPERHVSDTEFLLRVARVRPVVLCGCGLTWWRRHSGQEFGRGIAKGPVIARRYQVATDALRPEGCPLTSTERRQALRRVREKHLRLVASLGAHGKFGRLLALLRGTRF
jgi:hypothetical protein